MGPARHHHPELARHHGHHDSHTTTRFPVGIALSTAWNSHYVSEGRDNLDGDSLWGSTLEFSFQGLNLGAWYANSPDSSFDEFDAWLEYAVEIGHFEIYGGYTHLEFMDDDADDDEVGAGISYNGFSCGIVPAIDWCYSFEAEGSFIELSLTRECEVTPWLTLQPGLVFGINEGYITDGHDGANHIAVALSAIVPVGENVELGGYLSHTWGLDEDKGRYPGDETLDSFFFGGVALTVSF